MTAVPESQQQYGSLLTIAGENAEAQGIAQNKQSEFLFMAIGDANDTYIQPSRTQTALVHELHRIAINSMTVSQPTADSVPVLKVEAVLPDEINNLVIREFAIVAQFDEIEYLHAVGNCARIYVPPPANNGNVNVPVIIEMYFAVTSVDAIVIVDTGATTATQNWVNDKIQLINNSLDRIDTDNSQSIIDQSGKNFFIDSGFLVEQSDSTYTIKSGVGYIGGYRVELKADELINVTNKPAFIYIDAYRSQNELGQQTTEFTFVVSATELADYVDVNVQHYVCKIAEVLTSNIVDLRSPKNNFIFDQKINIKQFGAKKGEHLNAALSAAIAVGHTHIIIDDEYTTVGGSIDLVSDDIVLDFTGAKITHTTNSNLEFNNPTQKTVTFDTLPNYRDVSFEIDTAGISVGDSVKILTQTVGETGWNYKRQWTSTITAIIDKTISTQRSSTFNFNADDIDKAQILVNVAKNRKLTILNLDLTNAATGPYGWLVSRASVHVKNHTQHNSRPAYTMRLNSCYDVVIDDFVAYRGAYPFLLSNCSNVIANNIIGYDCHHSLATSDFTDGVYVDGCYGTGGLIESHPSFDINYRNVDITTGLGVSTIINLRSVGGSIINAVIRHKGSLPASIPYIQNVALVDSEPYQKDCRFVMSNVSFYENLDGNSYPLELTIDRGHTVIMRDVRVGGNVVFGGSKSSNGLLGGVYIDNVVSQEGIIYARGEILLNNARHEINADEQDGIYEITATRLGVSNHYRISGRLKTSFDDVSSAITKKIRLKGLSQSAPLPQFMSIEIAITCFIRHSNVGGFQMYMTKRALFVQMTGSGDVQITPNEIDFNQDTGLPNDIGSVSITGVTQQLDGAGGILGNWIDFTVEISSGGSTNAKLLSLSYDLSVCNS